MKQQTLVRKIYHAFRHEWDGCTCAFCGKERRHDIRDVYGRIPKHGHAGVFICTRCKAEFHRVVTPPIGCGDCEACDGNGWIVDNVSYCSGHELTDEHRCEDFENNHLTWVEEWTVRQGGTQREAYVKRSY